jgi:ABC transporter substrate binding protein
MASFAQRGEGTLAFAPRLSRAARVCGAKSRTGAPAEKAASSDAFWHWRGDLVNRKVVVIAAISGTPAALAAKAATTTIPIVFAIGGDPVAPGLVASLNRPGGNVTGVSFYNSPVVTKRLDLARELVPDRSVIALLGNPDNPGSVEETKAAEAARSGSRAAAPDPQCQYGGTDRRCLRVSPGQKKAKQPKATEAMPRSSSHQFSASARNSAGPARGKPSPV